MTISHNARIRLGLVVVPLWALTACGGGDLAATGMGASPTPVPSPPPPPAPAPLPTTSGTPADSTPAGAAAKSPLDVSVHSNGDALLVWVQTPTGGSDELHALRYQHATQTWDAASTIISSAGAISLYGPRVALDGSGNAMVVWTQSTGCFSRRYNVATGWATPTQLATNADEVVLATNRADIALAVWHNGSGLHSSSYSFASNTWSAATTLTASGNHPDLGMDAQGRAVLAWFRNDAMDGFTILAKRYLPSSGWTSEVKLDSDFVSDYPQVAVSGTGNALVCWEGSAAGSMGRNQVWSNQFSISNGLWSGAQTINVLNTTQNASDIAVRMDSDANGLAMWHEGGIIHAARYNAGTWASAINIDSNGYEPALILNNLGQAAGIWRRWSDDRIYGRTQTDLAQPWSAATQIQTGTESSGGAVTEASPTGHVIVYAWLQRIGGNFHVMRNVVR